MVVSEKIDRETANPLPRWRKTLYWFQNFFAVIESLGFLVWHGVLSFIYGLLAFIFWCCGPPKFLDRQLFHHTFMLRSYWLGYSLLFYNLWRPSKPIFIYSGYVPLKRPPSPLIQEQSAYGCAQFCENVFSTICVSGRNIKRRIVSVQEGFARRLYFSFAAFKVCEPSMCCGPCCGCWEPLPRRMMRWKTDFSKKQDEKTKVWFQEHYQCDSYEELCRARLASITGGGVQQAIPVAEPQYELKDVELGEEMAPSATVQGTAPPFEIEQEAPKAHRMHI